MNPILRRGLKWTGGILGTILVVLLALIGALQVPAVQQRLADYASSAASSPDMTIRIAGLSGGLPFGPRIASVELGDTQGIWATVEDAAVAIDPWALIGGEIHVELVEARRIVLDRLPVSTQPPPPPAPDAGGFAVPQLPAGLSLDRLSVPEIVLGAALAGDVTRFALYGNLGVGRDGAAAAALTLEPTDGAVSTRLALKVQHRPSDDNLIVKLDLDDPVNGPISRLAGLPGGRPITLRLDGEGPFSAFAADLSAAAAGAGITGRLTLGRGADDAVNVGLRARLDPGPFMPPDFAALAADGIDLDLGMVLAGDVVDVGRLVVAAGGVNLAAKLRLEGETDATVEAVVTLAPDLDLALLADVPPAFRPSRVALAGVADLGAGSARFERIEVTAPGASLTGTAELDEGFTTVDAAIDGTVPDLAQLPDAGLTGAGHLAVKAGGGLAPLDLAFDVAVTGENVAGDAELPHLLGDRPSVALRGRYGETGPIILEALTVATAALGLEGQGQFDPANGAIDAAIKARADDLARLGQPGLAGSLTLDGRITGTASVPVIDLALAGTGVSAAGTAFGDPRLTLKTTSPDGGGSATGRLDLVTGGAYPATVGTDLAFYQGQSVVLTNLLGEVLGAKLEGNVTYRLDSGLADGAVKVAIADLRRLAGITGEPVSGQLTLDLKALPRDGGQGADVTVDARGLGAAGATVSRLGAKAVLDDLLGAGRGKATVDAAGVASGTAMVDTLALKLDLASFADVAFDLALKGKLPAEATLALKGRYTGAEVTKVTLASLTGAVGPTPLRLEKPLEVVLGEATDIKGLALAFGKARITGDVLLGASASGSVKVAGLDLADLAPLAGDAALPAGTVNLDLDIKGNAGGIVLAARGIVPPENIGLDVAAADMPRIDIDTTVNWRGSTATLDARVTGIKGTTIAASGTVPVRIDGGIPMPSERGEMDVVVKIESALRSLAPLLPLGENRIGGQLVLDARIGGPLSAPRPSGRLTLAKGRVVNGLSGMELRDLALNIAFTGERMTIEQLSATDGEGGTLTGSGSASQLPDGDFAIDAAIKGKGFRFTRLDLATTDGDLDVAVGGTLTAPEITGKVVIREGRVEISAKIPPSVPVVEVRDPGSDTGNAPTALPTPPEPGAATVPRVGRIDLSIEAPGQFFVRGRGLDSEWRGTIKVTGAITRPDVSGGFEVVRGTYTLAGRPFKISEGALTFPSGLAAPPQLKIISAAPADDVEAKITISGPATALKIELSSDPPLPNDEVLSRVLFGRSVSNLTTSQAIRLGQTALELSGKGGGGDFVGGVRDALGLDRLDVGSDDSASGSGEGGAFAGSTLSAGRYVAEGVYLGFEQGLTPDSGSVNIEVEVYPRVTVEGNIGQANNTAVGLNYKFDY